MTRSPVQALSYALRESREPSRNWLNLCLVFTRTCFDVGPKYEDAAEAWSHTDHRHGEHSTPPPGVPVWWTGGSHGHGHVAISSGQGFCYTTDYVRAGKVDRAKISDITSGWGLDYKGWSEDINDERVYTPPPPRPVLDASDIRIAALRHDKVHGGRLLKRAVAKEVGPDLMKLGTSRLGVLFRRRYKKLQAKYLRVTNQPYHAADCDGIPGQASLRWLGKRHGFDVK